MTFSKCFGAAGMKTNS